MWLEKFWYTVSVMFCNIYLLLLSEMHSKIAIFPIYILQSKHLYSRIKHSHAWTWILLLLYLYTFIILQTILELTVNWHPVWHEYLTVWCLQVDCATWASAAPPACSASRVIPASVKLLMWPCVPQSTPPSNKDSSSGASSEKRYYLFIWVLTHHNFRLCQLVALPYSFAVWINNIWTKLYRLALCS